MTTTTVHVKTSLSRNFILSIVSAFLRMKQEVERDRVRDVLVDGEDDCRCLDSRKDPGSKSFFKALFCLPFMWGNQKFHSVGKLHKILAFM